MEEEKKTAVGEADAAELDEREAQFLDNDEEYSYSGYSETTGEELGQNAVFRDSEEVYSYTGYAEGEDDGQEERTESYGDFIIEEFSAATNVPRVAKMMHLPMHVVTYFFAAVYFIIGAVCVSLTEYVAEYLSLVVGSMMTVVGIVRFILALIRHEYRSLKTNQTATSLILAALGIMIIIQFFDPDDDPIMLISIVWGILGLLEAAHAFNHAFKRIAHSERCIYYLIKGLVELVVAFMLLYRPASEDAHYLHIIVFGINLIFDSITMLPPVKALMSMK